MANRYWVGGTATWDTTAGTKWATTSGGAGGSAVPTAADDVFFDANSGTGTVSLGSGRVARSINFTGFTGTFNHNFSITIGDATAGASNVALKLSSGMTLTVAASNFIFASTSATQQTIDFAGKSFVGLTFNGVGGSWILSSAATMTGSLTVTNGTFNTGNFNMSMLNFQINNVGTQVVTLGSSQITVSGIINVSQTAGLTLNSGTSKMILTGTSSQRMGASQTWYDIESTGAGLLLGSDAFTCHNLTFTPSAVSDLVFGANVTISNLFQVTGVSAAQRTVIRSNDSASTRYTITVNGTNTMSNVVFENLTLAGTASRVFSSNFTVGNGLATSGITYTSARTLYYVGDGADMGLASSWATSSGGAGGAGVPLPHDNQTIFDANSFSADKSVNMDVNQFPGFTFASVDQVITLNVNSTDTDVYLFKNVTLKSNMTVTRSGSQRWQIRGGSTWTGADVSIPFDILLGHQNSSVIISFSGNFTTTGQITAVENSVFMSFDNTGTYHLGSLSSSFSSGSLTLNAATFYLSGSGVILNSSNSASFSGANATIYSTYTGTSALSMAFGTSSSKTLGTVIRDVSGSTAVFSLSTGSHTYGTLIIRSAGSAGTVKFPSTTSSSYTTTITNYLELKGVSGNLLVVDTTNATNAAKVVADGAVQVEADYISLIRNQASGGANFAAGSHSTDAGSNTGWVFADSQYGAATIGGDADLSATGQVSFNGFSDISGDSDMTAVGINILVYQGAADAEGDATLVALATATLQALADTGGDVIFVALATATLQAAAVTGGDSDITSNPVVTTLLVEVDKTYVYKVYDTEGNYLGQWTDVISDFHYSQEINTAGSSIDVVLARNSDIKDPVLGNMQDQTSALITSQDSQNIVITEKVADSVGPGSNVNLNYNVDVYVYYGSFGELGTEGSDYIGTESGLTLSAQFGSPNGRIFFKGYISKYGSRYGGDENTVVTLTSHGSELDNYAVDNGGVTTVAYSSQDPGTIARSVMDLYIAQGGVLGYTTTTIELAGTIVSYTFKTTTVMDAIKKILQLSPSDWSWYVDMSTNEVHLMSRPVTPNHYFILGKHIEKFELQEYIDDIVNRVLFVGGEVSPGVNLYKKYEDTDSISNYRVGLKIMTDDRVTDETTADILAENEIDRAKDPRYRSTITILDSVYEIESIHLGDLIGFRNFGNYVDLLTMQVVGIDYAPDRVQLQLDTLLPRVSKRVEDIKRNLDNSLTLANPSTPTT